MSTDSKQGGESNSICVCMPHPIENCAVCVPRSHCNPKIAQFSVLVLISTYLASQVLDLGLLPLVN